MTEQIKNKKKQLIVIYRVLMLVCSATLALLSVFHERYSPEHPNYDTFAATYYSCMLFNFIGIFCFLFISDGIKEDIKEKNWFITYFIPNTETPPPFRYIVKVIDEQEAEVKFKEAYPDFKIVDISKN